MQLISFIRILFCYIMQLCLMQVRTSTGANTDGFIVGSKSVTTSGRFRREVGILMNFGAPSPQAGVITAWNFQYNCLIPRVNYHATLMMYRLNGATSQYQVIPESIQSISADCANTRPGVTLRGERTLMVEEQFRVEGGDIAAVCLPNDGRAPLRIASTLSVNRDGVLLSNIREFSINRGEGCSVDQLQTTIFRLQDLDLHQDLQLYLYAEAITVPEIITTTEAPLDSDNAIFTSTIPAETTSHDSPTSTSTTNTDIVSDHVTTSHDSPNNTIILSDHMTTSHDSTTNTVIVKDSAFDQSLDLAIIKIIIVTLVPVATVAIVITAAVLVIVVAMMWRRRCARQKNSTSATAVEIDSHKCYRNANTDSEFNMDQNVSYNICDTDALSQLYEYPDLSTTILDESNIYDSIDSQ